MRGCYPTAAERERESERERERARESERERERARESARERERESVCVCVRERERGCEARRSDAVRVGPAWLQRHSCKFITDVNLRRNGGGHTRVKTGEKSDLFRLMPGQGRARGIIYIQVRYMGSSDLKQKR